MSSWFIYIIETLNAKLYTGITTDVERRFDEHKNSKKGAKFTKSNPVKSIVYIEFSSDRSSASKREYEIKQMPRKKKLELIEVYKSSSISPS